MADRELYHYGVLGMKWGVRRYQNKDGSLTPAGKKRQEKLERREQKKAAKKLAKAQREWDENVHENWYKAYNKASDYVNANLDAFNARWKKVMDGIDNWNESPEYGRYIQEYEDMFEKSYAQFFEEMFGERPS